MGCTGVGESIRHFFNEKPRNHHLSRFMAGWKGRDSIVKATVAFAEITHHIVDLTDASEDVKKGFRSFTHAAKDARVVFGLMNVVEGTIPLLYQQIKRIDQLVRKLFGDSVTVDQVLEVFQEIAGFIGSACFAFAFGICRPIMFVEKHFKERVSASAHKIGQQFGVLMMVNHIAGFLGTTLAIIRDTSQYVRSRMGDTATLENMNTYFDKMTRHSLFILEKICELTMSVIAVFNLKKVPAAVRLTAAAGSALLGLYKVWQDTATPH